MNANKNAKKIKLKLLILFTHFLNTFEKKSTFWLNRNNFINLIELKKQVKANKDIKRLFENREVEMMITKPISRAKIIIGFFAGFCILLIPIVLLVAVLLFSISNNFGLFLWCISFLFEAITVVSFTLFFALFIESPVFSLLLSISVYVMSRIIGSFIAYIHIGARINEWFVFQSFVEIGIKVISVFMPRLDFCAKSSWLLGNIDYTMFFYGIAQCVVYSALLLISSIFEFNRKNF